jgi:hypothetical protein
MQKQYIRQDCATAGASETPIAALGPASNSRAAIVDIFEFREQYQQQ